MSADDVVDVAATRLAAAGIPSPRFDAAELLAHILGVRRSRLHRVGEIRPEQRRAFDQALERRVRREPLQHITGVAAFRHIELDVGPGVFVPRPETEVMAGVAVDEAVRVLRRGVHHPVVVDLCTGSGPVALSVAHEVSAAVVTGVELSADAHAYAVRNAARIAPAVDMRLGDIADAADDLAGRAHVVTANPPYIPLEAWESVDAEVRDHDPPEALWSGGDGLDAIRVVAEVAARLLVDDGLVLCEHADVQADSAAAVFAAAGDWRDVRDHDDLAGRPRFVTARRVSRSAASTGTMSG